MERKYYIRGLETINKFKSKGIGLCAPHGIVYLLPIISKIDFYFYGHSMESMPTI